MSEFVTVVHNVTGYIEKVRKGYFEALSHVFRLAEEGDVQQARAAAEAALHPEVPAPEAPAEVKEG
jgi:hypothetical protein